MLRLRSIGCCRSGVNDGFLCVALRAEQLHVAGSHLRVVEARSLVGAHLVVGVALRNDAVSL